MSFKACKYIKTTMRETETHLRRDRRHYTLVHFSSEDQAPADKADIKGQFLILLLASSSTREVPLISLEILLSKVLLNVSEGTESGPANCIAG